MRMPARRSEGDIVVDPAARPVTGDLDSVATWRFADAAPAAHVTFNRLQPRFSADHPILSGVWN